MGIKVVVVSEGEFANTAEFESVEEAWAFCTGVTLGANLYGAGSCAGYMKADLPKLNVDDRQLAALVREHLKGGGDA